MIIDLPSSYGSTRASLQRVATHVMARRRHQLTRRFGLRATPGGFGMPSAGPEHEVLRTSGSLLVRERAGDAPSTASIDLSRASLQEAADFTEVDLIAPFDVGHDTPAVGDAQAPLAVDRAPQRPSAPGSASVGRCSTPPWPLSRSGRPPLSCRCGPSTSTPDATWPPDRAGA